MGVDPSRAKSIFLSAVEDLAPKQWATYLDEVCQGDAELRRRVEALLAAHQGKDRLFDNPAAALLVPAGVAEPTEVPGTVIGRYKLLEKIGEGGMAVVYMAEQEQPIRRKVALKIIKLGMDTKQVIARFEAERQALAMMDHTNIAKVLDAGATETGRPYFVMELVQGVSITEYCDRNRLSTKERLGLFLPVCHAVQHAHQKGIIHRDIKPSNVMVTHQDGKPVPKVIDFGIAKATNQRLTEKTLFTRYAHIIGTPAYMSPEQAELSDLDIDTRTDIYSLGVLLYELLTGTTPFSEEELRKAGYVEMQRIIREQEPAKPSTRLITLGDTLTDIAKHRGCTPDLLRKTIRGDLDWIVMKSLEKDRARRYETPNSLASDILRHLEHEPVLARSPGTAYRLRKFLRRHRVPTLVGAVLVVVGGIVIVILSMWNEDRVQLAEAEGFKHRNILSQAREQYARADRDGAIETIRPIIHSEHVGPEAQLLHATILIDNRRSEEALTILGGLLNEKPEVAGAAHALLARILWESGSPDAEKLKEIEEHRQKAEALLPETAEAYFLRAMTAVTVKEKLAALDKALQLDSSHYESRRLRAFTYYASRKYERMKDDAMVMTILRPRDPLGYSLHAVAWRELGRCPEAIGEYDIALAFTAQDTAEYAELSTQRCEVFLRMGDYERVIAEAGAYGQRVGAKDVSPLRYHVFCALTALGEYERADTVFREIVRAAPTARNEFWFWATRYVFDTLEAGRSWHPLGRKPIGAAFLPMVEAEETYRNLSAKAKRLIAGGFTANWSPDGKKLAFSLGVHGYSGVAIYDPATGETELLIVPGQAPRWSPDGRHIAFVRDCEALRLEELTVGERKESVRLETDEEIWVMNADGTEARHLARGGWPSWGKDSMHVYYQSRVDRTLCSVSIGDVNAEAKQVMQGLNLYPSVSPDNQRVACLEGRWLKVWDLLTKAVVARWRVPFDTWGRVAWSPTGQELCLGAAGRVSDRTGLWIYRFDSNEPTKLLDGQIMAASWSPDGRKLVFGLRPPYLELWTADLDPDISPGDGLGPGQRLDEHWQDTLRLYARRMQADPQDAYAYSDRAQYYDYLDNRAEANADMMRWSAILDGTARGLSCVVAMPFDCELVFSAERLVNNIPILSIAFGQKGRREMKIFEIPMIVMPLLGFGLLLGVNPPPAHADFTFGTPVNLGTTVNAATFEASMSMTSDGLVMVLDGIRPGGQGNMDIWMMTRDTVESGWNAPVNPGYPLNTSNWDGVASISADGLTLFFSSDRLGGSTDMDLWTTARKTRDDPWSTPVNLGPPVNSSSEDWSPCISGDQLELYFMSTRPGGYGGMDLWRSTRPTVNDNWGQPVNLGPTVNSSSDDMIPNLIGDGLCMFFHSTRPGGYGDRDIWVTTRATRNDDWRTPVNLGPPLNTPYMDGGAFFSPDGSTIYFWSTRPGGYGSADLWQVSIAPIVDFNADGDADLADLVALIDNWGTDDALYDIGPMPWGDGKVDIEDLKVFMTYWEKENQPVQP